MLCGRMLTPKAGVADVEVYIEIPERDTDVRLYGMKKGTGRLQEVSFERSRFRHFVG